MTATAMGSTVGGDITSLDGSLYGYTPGGIARIDPTTGAITTTPVPGLVSFGAIWAADGHLYVSQASTVDEILGYTTPTPTLLALGTSPSPAGDGASCSTAPSRFLAAINDDYTAAPLLTTTGGTTASVLSNDTATGAVVAPNAVTATLTSDGGLTGTTIAPDGTLTVPANQPAGSYTLQYQLCSVAIPTLCDLATVALTLDPPATAPVTTPAAAGGASLAATGIDTLAPATGAAASIVVGLIAITIARRRRAARQ